MILYGCPMPAPNPRRVRMFLAEKGIDLPETTVNILKGRQKEPAFLAKNSRGQVPTLELDDGTVIAETVAICRYFEELQPEPPLFGRTPVEKAQVDMWVRRVEFVLMEPAANYWRHAHPRTAVAGRVQHKAFGESNRKVLADGLAWFDRELDGRSFVTGETFTVADICALATIDFAEWCGLEIPTELANLAAWRVRVGARPSAGA